MSTTGTRITLSPPKYHVDLLNKIGEQIIGNYVLKLRSHMRSEGYGAGRVETKSAVDLLWLLHRKTLIAPGKYDKLREILIDMGRQDLIDLHLDCVSGSDIVTDEQLSKLSGELGQEWKSFGLERLGFTMSDIDRCVAEERFVQGQMLAMLRIWKNKEGARATNGSLIGKLEAHGVDQTCIDCLME